MKYYVGIKHLICAAVDTKENKSLIYYATSNINFNGTISINTILDTANGVYPDDIMNPEHMKEYYRKCTIEEYSETFSKIQNLQNELKQLKEKYNI